MPIGISSSPRKTIVIAKPRFIHWLSTFTGPDSATARNTAISTQLIGLRSR